MTTLIANALFATFRFFFGLTCYGLLISVILCFIAFIGGFAIPH